MGPGIFLIVCGAILAFAVRRESPLMDLDVLGLILMVAGAGVIAASRRSVRRQRIVTRTEHPPADPGTTRVVQEQAEESDRWRRG